MLKTPPLQTATATIDTLCGRLQSATLLEDRRAAILGLRSFAKQYPASVASGSLRELIATLRRDGLGEKSGSKDEAGRRTEEGTGDVDTIRLVLETLLMLFNPDSGSPEAGDEIAFFMADEFSMRQDNITLLLNLLDPASPYADYYSRLYSVQLLSAICDSRPERLQECILSAPLGVSRLVGVLDDGRDAVRNAGLLLLVDLTSGANEDLRKIVAFEDVFGKVFTLIQLEGGLAEAGITAQDCSSLLANLVKGSASNQTMFRESGCVIQLAQLLQQAFPPTEREAAYVTQGREKSSFGLLQLLRLFLVPGESSTSQNQAAFFRAGTAQLLIDLGFEADLRIPIRTAALKCAAELIANNPPLQEAFAALTVITSTDADNTSLSSSQQLNGSRSAGPSNKGSARPSAEKSRTYIIEALLDLTLDRPQDDPKFRSSGYGLIQAYLVRHDRIKAHFLQRAIFGHSEHEPAANVLNTLSQPDGDAMGLLFASWIVQDLIGDNADGKAALAAVKEGEESEGEDVLSFVQALGSQLEGMLQQAADERVITAYASLLTVFMWEFAGGVDDLLAEGSNLLQALAATPKATSPDPLVAGLSVSLLGTLYEFSTKDSPIPRRTLAPLLTQKLGRTKYLDALLQLRRQPAIRDFDLMAEGDADTLLCKPFVDLFSLEYSRLRKAIDKDPGIEVLPPSAAEAGVDRDVLDDLRQQLQTAKDALAQTQEQGIAEGQKHEQERLAADRELQTATAEVSRLRKINQAMQQGHESELESLASQHEQHTQNLISDNQRAFASARDDTQRQVQTAVRETEASLAEKIQDHERRIAELGNSHRAEQSGHATTRQQLEIITSRYDELAARETSTSAQLADLSQRRSRLEKEHNQLQTFSAQSTADLERLNQESEQRIVELEGLTTQVRELQDELKGKDEELATERAGFAELEKELEAAKSAVSNKPADSVDNEAASKLEAELKETRESEKAAKEELESMLLVMGDIEAKRDGYREKIKQLGGELSEDEDEGDDGEEDGDEDGGEDEDDDREGVD
ncbi:Vesicle-mediated ER to Golgi transport protein [Vermiconidia calcicola]|uniref:Vesicle-mediated ER to Golgi transport protein n=1 Tax=Vermiconidia calcicola TaxID=1690605 RepID=A0ACC3MYR1_9PEZI|nr:Vesicle-mediated ER to Golgi transport protein [Vermiconidia calcicola]